MNEKTIEFVSFFGFICADQVHRFHQHLRNNAALFNIDFNVRFWFWTFAPLN